MKNKNRTALLGFGLFFLLGCAAIIVLIRAIYATPASMLVIPSSPLPPGAIDTIIAQTGAAAASQTAGVSGTQTSQFYTPTFTLTTTPLGGAPVKTTGTPLPGTSISNTAYQTSTRFVLAKWTPSQTATSKPKNPNQTIDGKKAPAVKTADAATEGAFFDNPKHLYCGLRETTLSPASPFTPGQHFAVTWVVKNTGAIWDHNSVDVIFNSGKIGYLKSIYNIADTVNRGETYDITIPMIAPNKAGNYVAIWYLNAGSIKFCELRVSITVQ